MSDDAVRRAAARDAERQRRDAAALRANLQRRKAQARERAAEVPGMVDAPAAAPQKGGFEDVDPEPRSS